MAQIALSNGGFALVDDDDLAWLSEHRWFAHGRKPDQYAAMQLRAKGRRTTITMHRLIAGAAAGQVVDHKNGQTLDNRRENLRVCSHQENLRNQRKTRTSGQPYKGVYLHRRSWVISLQAGAVVVRRGGFKTAQAAAWAYDEAAIEHHGDFARLNFPRNRDWLLADVHGAEWPPDQTSRQA